MTAVHGYSAYMQWEQEQLKAEWFMTLMRELFPRYDVELCHDPAMQKMGVDLLIKPMPEMLELIPPWDRKETRIDAKFRRKHYEDFIVELRHLGPTVNMEGWGLRGLAVNYLAYTSVERQEIVLIDWPKWWGWWLRERHRLAQQYPIKEAVNQTYRTAFVTLPWAEFEAEVPLRYARTNG